MTKIMIFALSGIFISCVCLFFPFELSWSQFQGIPTVSTRDHFNKLTGEIIPGTSTNKVFNNNNEAMSCPPQMAIYIHGVWVGENSLENPNEVFDRLKLSLQHDGYQFPLVGYSWNSDTDISSHGWNIAKHIAAKNGEILGMFVTDYKLQCPQTELRLIAHSLGSRVVLEALHYLDKNTIWNHNKFNLSSVHLVGSAVDNEEISVNPSDRNDDNLFPQALDYDPSVKSTYGVAIKNQVGKFYNLFNEDDNALEVRGDLNVYYPFFEADFALGNDGSDSFSNTPSNYAEYSVNMEIKDIGDADADNSCDLQGYGWVFHLSGGWKWERVCTIKGIGDNHFGYIGFRANINKIIDDGAVNRIVSDWNSQ